MGEQLGARVETHGASDGTAAVAHNFLTIAKLVGEDTDYLLPQQDSSWPTFCKKYGKNADASYSRS